MLNKFIINNKFANKIDKFLDSDMFLIVLSVFSLLTFILCRYFIAFEYIHALILELIGLTVVLLRKNLTPFITVVCFFVFGNRFTLLRSGDLAFIITASSVVVLIFAALIGNYIVNFAKEKRKLDFGKLWFGMLCGLVAVSLSGLFNKNYNKLFTLAIIGVSIGVWLFYLVLINATDSDIKKYAAKIMVFVGAIILCEVAWQYLYYIFSEGYTFEKIFTSRGKLRDTGWGMENTVGVLFAMSIPASFYLISENKLKWLFSSLPYLFFVGIIFTGSRGNFGIGGAVLAACVIVFFIKSKQNRKYLLVSLSVFALISVILLAFNWDFLYGYFVKRGGFDLPGDSRINLYKEALRYFQKYPVFGIGYMGDYSGRFVGIMWKFHSTPIQILASNGIFGVILFIPFFFQRYRLLLKKMDFFAFFALISVLAYELYGLIDLTFYIVYQLFFVFVFIAAVEKSHKVNLQ